MKVIVKRVGKAPEITDVENELKALQRAVDGRVEVCSITLDCCIICDEEWRIKKKRYNCRLLGAEFGGTILIAGLKGEEFSDLRGAEGLMRLLFKEGEE